MIQLIAGAAAGGLLVGALSASYLMAEYKDATWSAATNQIKVESAELLQYETDNVLRQMIEANAKVRALEAQHVQESNDLAVIQRRNRELATQRGGLRDPGRRPSCPDAVSVAAAGAELVERSASSSQLSDEASGVLLSAAAEVDALAEYARVCYEWKETVKQMFVKDEP